MAKKRVNYLNNKDILKEIHKSKLSYCYSVDDQFLHYDLILTSVDDINEATIQEAKENQAARLSSAAYEKGVAAWRDTKGSRGTKPKQAEFRVDPSTIKTTDIVFRVMTFEHVPSEPNRKKNPKTVADVHTRCNFPPFKHYALVGDEWKEVVRSHWEGGFDNGHFSLTHGKMTDKLAHMMMMLCERYSMRSNWRGYTYVDEMRSTALVQLSQVGLQFDESRSQNPFAYYTATITNSFTRVLNLEKRNQNIRDDILQDSGYMPSFNRQLTDEANQQIARDESEKADKQAEELKNAGYNPL
jgi:hypothetical protein